MYQEPIKIKEVVVTARTNASLSLWWTPQSGMYYIIRICTNPDMLPEHSVPGWYDFENCQKNYIDIPFLFAGTNYYVQVRSMNGDHVKGEWSDIKIAKTMGVMLSGSIIYDGTLNPILNCAVTASIGDQSIEAIMDDSGNFFFEDLPVGDCSLNVTTTAIPMPVHAMDALEVAKHFTGMIRLTGLKALAGEVTGDGAINSADSMLMLQRSVNANVIFPAGKWVFEKQTFPLFDNVYGKIIKGRSYGHIIG